MNPDLYFPLIIIGLGLISGPAMWYFINSVQQREKREIRQQYMELIKEKLDVLKTAIAMGHGDSEVKALDKRLEKLIGTEKMLETLRAGKADEVSKQSMQSGDLIDEVELLREGRKQRDQE